MAKETKPTTTDDKKPARKAKRKGPSTSRRTRYLALEQRVVFDAALGADIVDQVAKDTSAGAHAGDLQGDAQAGSTIEAPADFLRAPSVGGTSGAAPSPLDAKALDTAAATSAKALQPAADTDTSKALDSSASAPDSAPRLAELIAQAGNATDIQLGDTSVPIDSVTVDITAPSAPRELLIIDGSVENIDALKAAARPEVEVIVLDPSRDGVQQVGEILSSRSGVDAVHIVSHGRAGEITLGTTRLTLDTLNARAGEIEAWGANLDPNADLLLYGCEVAGGDRGNSYVETLARLTGADVAASIDDTGGWAQGGNWALETNVGVVQATLFGDGTLLASTDILLPTTSLTGATPWSTVFYGAAKDFQGDTQAGGGPDLIGDPTHGALYTNYDDKDTASVADDLLAFRVRLTEGSASFSRVALVGMDVNMDGTLDAFVGVDNQGGTPYLRIWDVTSGGSTPSNTSIATTSYAYAETAANFKFEAVSAVNDPNWNNATDISGEGLPDYFLSWQFSYNDLTTFLGTQGITGVTKDSTMQLIFATSTQSNNINADIGGVAGATSSTSSWFQIGAGSGALTPSNQAPTITSFGGQDAATTSVVAGTTAVGTVTAVDPNSTDGLRYYLAGGADSAKFSLNATSGALTFLAAPSATVAGDADGDGIYNVIVGVRDYTDNTAAVLKGASDLQQLSITVNAVADTTAPTLDLDTGVSPSDNALNVAPNANLFLNFSEAVQAGTGSILIRNAVSGAIVATINVTDTEQVSINGSTVTIDPILALTASTAYYVEISPTAFKDTSGNTFIAVDGGAQLLSSGLPAGVNDTDGGLGDGYKWNFTTGSNALADSTFPTLFSTTVTNTAGSALTPADNQTGVAIGTNITLTFSEAVFADSGFFTVRKSSDGSIIARIAASDSTQVTYNTVAKTVTINPNNDLAQATDYYVQVDALALQDQVGNHFAGFTDVSQGVTNAYTFNFRTGADTTAPTVTDVSAANINGTWTTGDDIYVRVNFSEAVNVTGAPTLLLETGTTDRTASYFSGSGSDTLIFKYTVQAGDSSGDLNYKDATTSLSLAGGTILDAAGNNAALALPTIGGGLDLAGQKAIVIDSAPVNTVPVVDQTVYAGGTLTLNSVSVSDVDATNLNVTLTASHGVVTLNGNLSGLTFAAGDGVGDATMTFSGSKADINAALAGMSFSPTAGVTDNTTLTITTRNGQTAVSTGNPVLDTDVITIDIVGGPVLTGSTPSISYAENDASTAINPLIVLTDAATSTISSATVSIAGGTFVSGQDVLAANTGTTGIVANYNAATGVLTLTGTGASTLADFQAVLRSVTYANSSDTPTTAARSINVVVTDASSNVSATVSSTVNLAAVDDAPTLGVTAGNVTYTQGDVGGASPFSGAAVSTVESSQTITGLSFAVSNLRDGASEQVLINGTWVALTHGNSGIASGLSYSVAVTGTTAVVTVSGGLLSQASAQSLVDGIQYKDTPGTPTAGIRTITVTQLVDSGSNTGANQNTASLALSATVNVVATNAAPTLSNTSSITFVENASAAVINSALTVADTDNTNLVGATVSITGNFATGQDVLAFTNQNGIIGSYNATTGELTLSGTATKAQYEAALRTVTYRNTSDAPSTSSRTVSFRVNDGTVDSSAVDSTIAITAVNDAPAGTDATITLLQGAVYTFGTTDFGFSDATDGGANTFSAVKVATLPASGTLEWKNGSDVWVNVTLNQVVSAADITDSKLRYTPAGTTNASFTFQVQDSGGTDNSGVDLDASANTLTLNVSTVNQTPVLSAITSGITYNEATDAAGKLVSSGITITDADWTSSTTAGAIVRISSGFVAGQDVLSATTVGSITASYNANTGILTLSGTDTRANYQSVLQSIKYTNSSDNPSGTRTISYAVSDGTEFSDGVTTATTTITITGANDAAVLASPTTAIFYVEGSTATAINPFVLVSDVDNANLASATIQITGNYQSGQDLLSFSSAYGITASWNSANGTLTLTPGTTATVADFQAALREVKYSNSSSTPNTSARTVSFTVNDGSANSNTFALSTVNVSTANSAPTLTTGATPTYTEDGSAQAVAPAIVVGDVDTTNLTGATVRISNFVSGDTLAVTLSGGVSIASNINGVLTLTGTVAPSVYQTVLQTVTFSTASQNPDTTARNVVIQVNDGTTGGNNLSTELTSTVSVNSVNDAPVGQSPVLLKLAKNSTYTFKLSDFAISTDAESNSFDGIKISNKRSSGTVGVLEDWSTSSAVAVADNAVITKAMIQNGNLRWTVGNSTSDSAFTYWVMDDGGTLNSGVNTATSTNTFSIDHVNPGSDVNQISPGGTLTAAAFTEDGAAQNVASAITVGTAPTKATVTISANYAAGDTLTWNNAGSITGAYQGGVLSLTGTGTAANWQSVLQSVKFTTASQNPSTLTRTVTIDLFSGSFWSTTPQTNTIGITAVNDVSVLASPSTIAAYTEGAAASVINPYILASDVDDTNIEGATITISANYASGDTLNFTPQSGITVQSNSAGVLTLTGTSSVANYQAALRSITYSTSSATPSTSDRTVSFKVNDGSGDSNTIALSTVKVSSANSAPTLTTGGTPTFTEDGAAQAIAAGIVVADAEGNSITGATVRLTNFVSGDTLGFTDQLGIAGSYSNGVLTLSGTTTVANYQTALRTVTYFTASNNPDTTARNVLIQVNDGSVTGNNLSNQLASTITVVGANDAVAFSSAPATIGFSDSAASDSFFARTGILTVTDADGPTTTFGIQGVTPVGNVATAVGTYGTLTLNTVTGAYSYAPNNTAINALTSAASDIFTFTVSDGTATPTQTFTVNLSGVNDTPVLSSIATALAYTENGTAAAINTVITVSDAEGTLSSATVQITGNYAGAQDALSFTNVPATMGDIAQTGNTGGLLTLTSAGGATAAEWQAALRAVKYSNSSDSPNTLTRTVTYQVNDGAASSNTIATSTISVTSVNDVPVLAGTPTTPTFTEGGAAQAVNSALTVTDLDNTKLAGATVWIANYVSGQDALEFSNVAGMGNIAASFNSATGSMTLSSLGNTATTSEWQNALQAVKYSNASVNPTAGTRTINFVTTDGTDQSNVMSSTLTVAAVNNAAVLSGTSTLSYTENNPASIINGSIVVSDVDNATLVSATAQITGNFLSNQDVLAFTNNGTSMGNITASFNSGSGTLTLSSSGGTATTAEWQAALSAVKYSNTSENPSTSARTVTFQVNDGSANSNTTTSTINVAAVNDAPVLTTPAVTVAYVENASATAINTAITLTDADSTNLSSATVSITGNYDGTQDVLAFANVPGTPGGHLKFLHPWPGQTPPPLAAGRGDFMRSNRAWQSESVAV